MAQQQTQPQTDETRETYLRNYETLHAVLSGGRTATRGKAGGQAQEMSVRLERLLVDDETGRRVAFDGDRGIELVLGEMSDVWPGLTTVWEDQRLVGLAGTTAIVGSDGEETSLPVALSLGPAAQLAVSVGPHESVEALLGGLFAFDRAVHVAATSLDRSYSLRAEGYDPFAEMPLDVPLVPVTRWTLLNAHLGQCGRYARDMMRCCCATQVSMSYGDGREAIECYRLAVALSPLLTFLTDDVRSFRGSGARRCPRMVRSIIWDEVDPSRCGVVEGTFGEHMSFDRYIEWLMDTQPIEMTDAMGTTTSSGKRTVKELLGERVLSGSEALHLFDTVYPHVRLGASMELLQADSLRPRMAAGYAAFVKGVFSNARWRDDIWSRLRVTGDADVELCAHELRMRGWDADVYGTRAHELVRVLLDAAYETLSAGERAVLDNIAELWEVRMVPRDEFVMEEVRRERGW